MTVRCSARFARAAALPWPHAPSKTTRRPGRRSPHSAGGSGGLADDLRFEDAARLRDRLGALEEVVGNLAELDRLRALRVCVLVPAEDERFRRAFFVSGGRVVATRTVLPGEAGRVELEAGLAAAARAAPSAAPEDLDELLLIGSFLRTPRPEQRVIPLDDLAARAA